MILNHFLMFKFIWWDRDQRKEGINTKVKRVRVGKKCGREGERERERERGRKGEKERKRDWGSSQGISAMHFPQLLFHSLSITVTTWLQHLILYHLPMLVLLFLEIKTIKIDFGSIISSSQLVEKTQVSTDGWVKGGLSIQRNIIQPYKKSKCWHLFQHGWTLRLWCSGK